MQNLFAAHLSSAIFRTFNGCKTEKNRITLDAGQIAGKGIYIERIWEITAQYPLYKTKKKAIDWRRSPDVPKYQGVFSRNCYHNIL